MVKLVHLFIFLTVAGCAHNPSDQKIFANTLASYNMREGILASIKAQQGISQPDCPVLDLIDAKTLRRQDLIILEEWTIEACGLNVIYDVQISQQDNKPRQYNVTRRRE